MYEMQSAVSNDTSAIIASASLPGLPAGDVIETRFGKVTVQRDKPIVFSKGLLGFPASTRFCLTDFPLPKFGQFKLLQSLEEDELSFIALPLDIENSIIERNDIVGACAELGFNIEDTILLLIVSVHRELKQVKLSGNARAPVFVHTKKKRAEQYVLHNNKYLVRHMLME